MNWRLQLIVLGAACFGAFLSRFGDKTRPTLSMATVWTVLSTGAVTFVAMANRMVPDSWQIAADNNPLQAGIIAFLLSGLGGSVLVDKAQDIIDSVSARKKDAAQPQKEEAKNG